MDGVRVRLVGDDGAENDDGVVEIRSPAAAIGYLPEATPDLSGGLFRTSDLGRWRDGELVLGVDSPAWSSRLRFLIPSLLQKLRDRQDPQIRHIALRVVPRESPPHRVTRPVRLSTANAQLLRQTARAMDDDRLRAALLRVASHSRNSEE